MRYFNGEVRLEVADISAPGFGIPWGHSRTYSNQQRVDFDRGNGWNWNPVNLPHFGASTLSGSALALYGNLYNLRYFYASGSPTYISQFGDLATLVHLATPKLLRLTEPDGSVWMFNDLTVTDRPGGFKYMIASGGAILSVTQESGDQILEIQRDVTAGGVQYTDSFLYEYISGGELNGHISACTHRSSSGTGPWTNLTRVIYSYYGSSDLSGSLGDLQTATRQILLSSGIWSDLGTDYYRYYKTGNEKGAAHDIKFVCSPESFARLDAYTSGNPFTASDLTVSLFADFYYEFDSNDRVSLERVYSGSKTITFSYTRNPRYSGGGSSSSSASATPGNNVWIYRTVETRPDYSQKVTYANFAGQTMLSVLKTSATSADQWCTFFLYDDAARQIWMAQPSAVTGYDD